MPALPSVPTVADSGLPGYDVTLWYGIVGPEGMPPEVVNRLNDEVNRILAKPETATKFETDAGSQPGSASNLTNCWKGWPHPTSAL
ncbi:hypothetical protein CBM2626_B140133 [Cupriavidus taiwanensis]|nr:hypothetical protein CBM2626_B140133 [Cupriavidus taiwanensis]